MIIASVCMLPFRYGALDAYQIEVEAKKLGMIYPGSNRVMASDEEKKTTEPAIGSPGDDEQKEEGATTGEEP